ncbi:unnamed protein product [Effrenium voratum]|nr:unnamed protein product [Effrenium voratum]|mmetsp:Transcript_136947/g.324442  ORF Transcript_136947/g.324442 Transcript_136947/m.324442 type:complete len:172 (+) Transcript_136947:45-560(+)
MAARKPDISCLAGCLSCYAGYLRKRNRHDCGGRASSGCLDTPQECRLPQVKESPISETKDRKCGGSSRSGATSSTSAGTLPVESQGASVIASTGRLSTSSGSSPGFEMEGKTNRAVSFAKPQDNYSRDLHETYLLDSPLLEADEVKQNWFSCKVCEPLKQRNLSKSNYPSH